MFFIYASGPSTIINSVPLTHKSGLVWIINTVVSSLIGFFPYWIKTKLLEIIIFWPVTWKKAMRKTVVLEEPDLIRPALGKWHPKHLGGEENVWPSFLMEWVLDNYPLKYSEREKARKVVVVVVRIDWKSK